jgi:hypothetical protein
MKARKKAATVVVAALGAIGLALPATASAAATRSYSLPAYDPTAVVIIDATSTTSVDVVSWSDVSWADSV